MPTTKIPFTSGAALLQSFFVDISNATEANREAFIVAPMRCRIRWYSIGINGTLNAACAFTVTGEKGQSWSLVSLGTGSAGDVYDGEVGPQTGNEFQVGESIRFVTNGGGTNTVGAALLVLLEPV